MQCYNCAVRSAIKIHKMLLLNVSLRYILRDTFFRCCLTKKTSSFYIKYVRQKKEKHFTLLNFASKFIVNTFKLPKYYMDIHFEIKLFSALLERYM